MADVDAMVTGPPAETDASLAVLRLPLRQRQVIACRLQGVTTMDDNDLLAAVREDFAGVRMNTEAGAILADGDSLRHRRHRRRAYGAAATALCAAAAISVAALTPGSSGTSGSSNVQLTAWTVQKQPDGTVDVTIREVLNFAGLQRKLNAEGVPAVVYADEQNPPGCVNTKASADMSAVLETGPGSDNAFFIIHPAAIPSGSELLLDVFRGTVPRGPVSGWRPSASRARRVSRPSTSSR